MERVGSGDPPASDRVVELPGTTILPGFVDAHVHLSGTGAMLDGLDLSEAGSKEELLAMARRFVAERPGAALGMGFDETRWRDPSFPTGADLNQVSSEPLIVLRADGYLSVVNSAALEASGGEAHRGAERDPDGNPTGVLRDEANALAQRWYFDSLPDTTIQEAQLRATGVAVSRGVTCVHEMAIPDKRGRRDIEVLLAQQDDLPLDVLPYVAERDIPYVMDLGQSRIGGDLFLDGSIGARTAALLDPYSDADGGGDLAYEDDELAEFLHNVHLAGLQAGLHAIGDRAIDQSLRVWERVYGALDSRRRRHFRARRHRLEHFEMASEAQIERAAALGMAISIQPGFDALWGHGGGMYEQRLGSHRAGGMNAFRSIATRGLEIGGGSDSPVTPLDPMFGIWALENHHDESQRFSRLEAVRVFTVGAARLGRLEKKGVLEPGSAADFAAYDEDPLEVPDVRDLRPVLTVSRGRDVFAR